MVMSCRQSAAAAGSGDGDFSQPLALRQVLTPAGSVAAEVGAGDDGDLARIGDGLALRGR